MTRRILSFALLVCISLSIFPSVLYSQSFEITNGLNWLSINQNQDGSWDSLTAATTGYYATATVLETFGALNETSQQYTKGLAWSCKDICVNGLSV